MKRCGAAAAILLLAACSGDPAGPRDDPAICGSVAVDALELPPSLADLEARRDRLAAVTGDGVLVLAADSPDPDPGNNGYRGDSNLYYLAGLDVPGSWLVLHVRAARVDSAILFLPRPASPPPSAVSARSVTGAHAVRCAADLSATVRRLVTDEGRPLLTHGRNPAFTDTLVRALVQAGRAPALVDAQLARLRLIKQESEVARLRRAAGITAQSIRGAVSSIRAGSSEATVAAAILAGFQARGADRASFPSIVAAGGSALTLHYNAQPCAPRR